MGCQDCGDEVWRDHDGSWRHHDEDERGLDGDHEADPSEYDEELADREDSNDHAQALRNEMEMGGPVMAPKMSLRSAAIEFVAEQNVNDREELLFRAHRHASNLTGQLPVMTAQRMVQDFVAAVNREFVEEKPEPQKTVRTASVNEFPDELMF